MIYHAFSMIRFNTHLSLSESQNMQMNMDASDFVVHVVIQVLPTVQSTLLLVQVSVYCRR